MLLIYAYKLDKAMLKKQMKIGIYRAASTVVEIYLSKVFQTKVPSRPSHAITDRFTPDPFGYIRLLNAPLTCN